MTSTRAPRRSRATTAALAAPLVAALLLTGCTSGGSSTAGSSGGGGADSAAVADSAAGSAAESRGLTGSGASGGAEFQSAATSTGGELAGDAARQVITTGSASLVVDSPAQAADQISVFVEGAGGRVEQRSVQTPEGGPASATLTVRVPADGFSGTLDELSRFGEVSDVDVTATDVTAQASDLDARTAALRTSTERLTALLAGAASTEEVVAAESALTQRQAELDSLTAQRALLAGQVEMASLSLYVTASPATPVVEAGGFLGGLATGWRGLVGALGTALVVAGVLLPWLVALALVGVAALGVTRLGRRLRARAGAGSPVTAAGPSSSADEAGGGTA